MIYNLNYIKKRKANISTSNALPMGAHTDFGNCIMENYNFNKASKNSNSVIFTYCSRTH